MKSKVVFSIMGTLLGVQVNSAQLPEAPIFRDISIDGKETYVSERPYDPAIFYHNAGLSRTQIWDDDRSGSNLSEYQPTIGRGNPSTFPSDLRWCADVSVDKRTKGPKSIRSRVILDTRGGNFIEESANVNGETPIGKVTKIAAFSPTSIKLAPVRYEAMGPTATFPIEGNGTANYIPKFTGYKTIGNSIIKATSTGLEIGSNAHIKGSLRINNDLSITFGKIKCGGIEATRDLKCKNLKTDGITAELDETSSSQAIQVVWLKNKLYRLSSSRKYKEDIRTFLDDFSKILKVRPVEFVDKESGELGIGYVAEEFDIQGLNRLVIYNEGGEPEGLNYRLVSLYLVEVVKDQQREIEELRAITDEFMQRVSRLMGDETGVK